MSNPYLPKIEIIEEDYEIPQLERRRRISALLPHDYYQSKTKYPVLYLHDGQNLFDEQSPFGNWAIDESLATLAQAGHSRIIVIAIDHGGEDRLTEYLPFSSTRYGKGQGKLYIEFLRQTLKPYVDKKYRVLKDAANTGIGGSSMGGLISLYAGLKLPSIFNKMMIFSPSLWLTPKIYTVAKEAGDLKSSMLYLYAGGQESRAHLPNVLQFGADLLRVVDGDFRFHFSHNPDGIHHEADWSQEFPRALKWLYFEG